MSPATRKTYFALWIAAATANGWQAKDDATRKAVTLECMAAVRGPAVGTSDPAFGPDETTAIFTYLEFLAHQDDLNRSARWADCQQDYHAFNRARQADWHKAETYGTGGGKKLVRDRFAGEESAVGGPLEKFDPEAIRKRHLTMATRHQKKVRTLKKVASLVEDPADRARITGEPSAGQISASQPAASPSHPATFDRPSYAPSRPAAMPARGEGDPF